MPSINREFGTVILGGQNVAYDVVADGWAKVRERMLLCVKLSWRSQFAAESCSLGR